MSTLSQNCHVHPILESRLQKGLSLYEPQDTILVCGNMPPKDLVPKRCEAISEAEAMKCYLIEKGIVADNIYKEEKSTTTFGNAFYGAEIIKQLAPKCIVIVANEFHYPLIKYSFNKVLGDHYSYTFAIIPDSTLDASSSDLEKWKDIIREMTSTYYPMLFNHVADGDREEITKILEGPIPSAFIDYVKQLLKLPIHENIKEFISG